MMGTRPVVIGENRSDSEYVLKVAPTGFADGWNVGHEKESKVTAGVLT